MLSDGIRRFVVLLSVVISRNWSRTNNLRIEEIVYFAILGVCNPSSTQAVIIRFIPLPECSIQPYSLKAWAIIKKSHILQDAAFGWVKTE